MLGVQAIGVFVVWSDGFSGRPTKTTRVSQRVDSASDTGLAGTLVAVFFEGVKPTLENGEGVGFDFEEGDAAAQVRLDVNDFCLGVEEIFAGENFHEHESVLRERIHHVEVAAVKA